MYNTEKLYKSLKRNFELFVYARNVLDTLVLITKGYSAPLKDIQKHLKDIDEDVLEEITKLAPEFIKIGLDDRSCERSIISPALRKYYRSVAFQKKMSEMQQIDNTSLSKKRNTKELTVLCLRNDMLTQPYNGMLPTRQYINKYEVFVVTNEHLCELKENFPSHDIDRELSDIYEYFRDLPYARREGGSIRVFIEKWLKGELIKNARKHKVTNKKSAQEFYTGLLNNGI